LPRHDYTHCAVVLLDVYRPAAIGARADPPPCPTCGQPMAWIPATTAMDVGGVKTAAFRAFTTTDGRGQRILVDSLRKLRQVEREAAHRVGAAARRSATEPEVTLGPGVSASSASALKESGG